MTKKQRSNLRQQYGVVPYRLTEAGELEILLITTRETRRWMVPKGWPIKKLGPLGTGLREALEESGVIGEGGPEIGSFRYIKKLRSGQLEKVQVALFAMKVAEEIVDWPEKDQRQRRWFDLLGATEAVDEVELRAVLANFPDRLAAA